MRSPRQASPRPGSLRYAGKDRIPTVADVIQFEEGDPQQHEYEIYLQPNQRIWLELITDNWLPGSRIEESTDVAVAIRRIEMEGPIIEQWPPRGHRLLLGDRDARSLSDKEMSAILSALAPRLFRRPVVDSLVADYVKFYREIRTTEEPLFAFKETVKAMMASPMFLYHVEPAAMPRMPTRWPIVFPTSCGDRRLTRNYWASRPPADCTIATG